METSKDIKDIKYNNNGNKFDKDSVQEIIRFVKKNARYFIVGLVVILVLIVVAVLLQKDDAEQTVQYTPDGVEIFAVDAYPEVMTLIEQYYNYYAAGDFESLQTIAAPFSAHELAYMSLLSQYVEGYQNMTFYTKTGLDSGSYMVNVYLEMKFEGVDTLAPGLDFFYVRTNEEGTLYIDNSYSEYNMKNNDNPLDVNIHNLIKEHEQHEDLIALLTETTVKFNTAIESDANLSAMVNETIPTAISAWMADVIQGIETPVPETEIVDTTQTPETENVQPETEVTQPESEVVQPETESESESESESEASSEQESESNVISFAEGTVIRLDGATKVREEMTTESGVVATLYKGDKVTVVMSYAEGWTKVTWGNKSGYIRSDLLQ